jgi:hypothetical protein
MRAINTIVKKMEVWCVQGKGTCQGKYVDILYLGYLRSIVKFSCTCVDSGDAPRKRE